MHAKRLKNIEMILDAAEIVLGYFGFERTTYRGYIIHVPENGGGLKN